MFIAIIYKYEPSLLLFFFLKIVDFKKCKCKKGMQKLCDFNRIVFVMI